MEMYKEEEILFDDELVPLKYVLSDSKYILLLNYLRNKNFYTTNDIKKLSVSEYNKLKMEIPLIMGVGDIRLNSFLGKLDEIRRKKYENVILEDEESTNINVNNNFENVNDSLIIKKIGDFPINDNWKIEINLLKLENNSEYIDIRQVGDDGIKGKYLAIKKENFEIFKQLINSIDFSENIIESTDNVDIEILNSNYIENNIEEKNFMNFFSRLLKGKTSLKTEILANENKIYEKLGNKYNQELKLFRAKIQSFIEDGDIVKFLNNKSILNIKEKLYNDIHNAGMKTAIDIMNEYNKINLKYTTINNIEIGKKYNTNTICCIANNFNNMLGMYYMKDEKILVLKTQIQNGQYHDRWLIENKKLIYCLQNEKENNFKNLTFSNEPNRICKNIICGLDKDTKVYLFYRIKQKTDYIFVGEVKLEGFCDNNKAVIINILN